MKPTPSIISLFDVPIANISIDQAIDAIIESVQKKRNADIIFINAHCLNIAYLNHEYRNVIHSVNHVFPDGSGVYLACKMKYGLSIPNVNGTDLFPRLCERIAGTKISIYFLGSEPGVATRAAETMINRFPGLQIAGTRDGYFFEHQEDEVINQINNSGADILLVAFGVPKQELWLNKNRDRLNTTVRMGVGGLFDFYSGRIPRAPKWMRIIGFEWLWRFLQEPKRLWRRYLIGNPLFLYRILRDEILFPKLCSKA